MGDNIYVDVIHPLIHIIEKYRQKLNNLTSPASLFKVILSK